MEKPLSMYRVERKQEHGYWMHSLRIYAGVDIDTIEERIAHCGASNYSKATQVQIDGWRAEYEAMRAAGVTHILDPKMYRSTWINAVFQQYKAAADGEPATYCEANIQLPDSPDKIVAATKLFQRLDARMRRIDKWHRWESLDLAVKAADRMCDHHVELFHYRATNGGYGRTEYVLRSAEATARLEYSLVAG